jgi:hypothetical protein
MKIDESFVLKKGEILTLKKKGGYIYLEFKRRNEKHLDDIIELEYKSTGSKKKDPSVWIIEKDFIIRVLSEINSNGFEFHKLEKAKKEDKKDQNDSQ